MLPATTTKQKRLRSKMIILFKQSKYGKQSVAKFVKEVFETQAASSPRHVNASCFMHEALKRVFIKMNTVVSSSVAVERVFSIEDILNLKRTGLSDIHLEILLFFKASK